VIAQLRLANWDVNRPVAPSRVAAVRAAIGAVGADIIVLTEAHDALCPGYGHSLGSLPGRDGRHAPQHRWVKICSRFPLQPLPVSDAHRTVAARVDPGGGTVVLFGTVLPWKGSTWRDAAPHDAFREALRLQMEDVKRLRHAFPDDDVFMIGDFNQDLCGGHYAGTAANGRLPGAHLHDAGLVAITAGRNDPVRRAAPAYACSDHMSMPLDARWTVGDVRCWPDAPASQAGLSDHFGVVADLFHTGSASRGTCT
jgi:endonuclease/exonuclease/phosphatase family metal-dependent hydrolase